MRVSRSVVASVLVLAGMSGAGFVAGRAEAPETAPLVVESSESPPEAPRDTPSDSATQTPLPAEPAESNDAPEQLLPAS